MAIVEAFSKYCEIFREIPLLSLFLMVSRMWRWSSRSRLSPALLLLTSESSECGPDPGTDTELSASDTGHISAAPSYVEVSMKFHETQ